MGGPGVEGVEHRPKQHRRLNDVHVVSANASRRPAGVRIGEVLRARPQVDADVARRLEIATLGIGVHERPAPLPVLRRALRVQDQRIGRGTLQDRILAPGQVIDRGPVREREAVRAVLVVLVLLSRGIDDAGEAMVHPHQTRRRRHAASRRRKPAGPAHRRCIPDRRSPECSARSANVPTRTPCRWTPARGFATPHPSISSYRRKLTRSRTTAWPIP